MRGITQRAGVRSTQGGWGTGWAVSPGNGHGGRFGGGDLFKDGKPKEPFPSDVVSRYWLEHYEEARRRLGATRAESIAGSGGGFCNFPNFAHNGTFKVYHPRGPLKIEEWMYLPVERDAPQEMKDYRRREETRMHGGSGGIEQDDMNNFIQCTEAGLTSIGRGHLINQQIAIGHETVRHDIPGGLAPAASEMNQRSFYGFWAEMMDAPSWGQVSIAPRTKV